MTFNLYLHYVFILLIGFARISGLSPGPVGGSYPCLPPYGDAKYAQEYFIHIPV